jgi:hypothetical protein
VQGEHFVSKQLTWYSFGSKGTRSVHYVLDPLNAGINISTIKAKNIKTSTVMKKINIKSDIVF